MAAQELEALIEAFQLLLSNLSSFGVQIDKLFEGNACFDVISFRPFHATVDLFDSLQPSITPQSIIQRLLYTFALFQKYIEVNATSTDKTTDSENTETLFLQLLKLGSFLFHESFLIYLWSSCYYQCIKSNSSATETSPSIFYDQMKWIYYAHKLLSNFYFFAFHHPYCRAILHQHQAKTSSTTPDDIEEEEEGLSVYSYDIFTYHVINSFLVATYHFLQFQQSLAQEQYDQLTGVTDAPSIHSTFMLFLLPKAVSQWLDFFDENILRKFFHFFLTTTTTRDDSQKKKTHKITNQNQEDTTSNPMLLMPSDRLFVFDHLMATIDNLEQVLQLLTVLCQIATRQRTRLPSTTSEAIDHHLLDQLITILLRRSLVLIRGKSIEENESDSDSEPLRHERDQRLSQLIERILLRYEFSKSLIESLFSQPTPSSSSSSSTSSGGANQRLFHKRELLVLLCRLVEVWGQPYHHNNSLLTLFISYSHWILTIINTSLQRSDFSIPVVPILSFSPSLPVNTTSHVSSVESVLMAAISKGLESSFPMIRYHVMQIAEAYARVMGYSLQFDELREMEKQQLEKKPVTDNPSDKPLENKDKDDSEEEDEDEIEGYYLSKEYDSIVNDLFVPSVLPTVSKTAAASTIAEQKLKDLLRLKKLYYLKQCLELLTMPEGSGDVRSGIILALEQLPIILSHLPLDGKYHAESLLFQLLNLSNQFNIDNFEELRSKAIISLVKTFPLYTFPILNQSILNTDLAVGLRIQSIQYHRILGTLFYQENQSRFDTPSESKEEVEKEEESSPHNHHKTVIKRPRRYQLLKQKYLEKKTGRESGSQKNIFQEYSSYFFAPLLQLLQDFYQRYHVTETNSSNLLAAAAAITVSEKNEPFNLIDQTFSSNTSSKTRYSEDQSELQSLRLPSLTPAPSKRPLIQEINETADFQLSNRQLKAPEVVKPSKTSDTENLLPDDTDLLLPYDALLSLSVFMNYQIFHPQYQTTALICIELAIAYYRQFRSSLTMRRGALCLLVTVLEGLLQSFQSTTGSEASFTATKPTKKRIQITGVLDSLLKITALEQQLELEAYSEQYQSEVGHSGDDAGERMKTEVLSKSSLLSFAETLLQQMEGQQQTSEKDPICQQLMISFLTIVQQRFLL